MGSTVLENHYYLIFSKFILLLILATTSLCYADDGFIYSRATFYGSPDCLGNPTGACGFGEYGRTVNNGEVAGVARLYRNGSGCGACYQVRCKIPAHCSEDGTKLVVTDFGVAGHNADFILSARAYANLAKPNNAAALYSFGVVDIEYKRIACRYGYNLMLRIHERSSYPSYLAVVGIYQAGMYDITALQVWLEDCKEWRGMRRVYGAVWDMENPPMGSLNLRVQVSGGADAEVRWIQIASPIPADWKAEAAYDTGIQLN